MGKKIYSIEIECLQANRNKTNSTIVFANNVQQTEQGPASNTGVNFNVPDKKLSLDLDTGKKYLISIHEIDK